MSPEKIVQGRKLLEALAAPRVHGHGARGQDDTEAYVIDYAMKNLSTFLDDAEKCSALEEEVKRLKKELSLLHSANRHDLYD